MAFLPSLVRDARMRHLLGSFNGQKELNNEILFAIFQAVVLFIGNEDGVA